MKCICAQTQWNHQWKTTLTRDHPCLNFFLKPSSSCFHASEPLIPLVYQCTWHLYLYACACTTALYIKVASEEHLGLSSEIASVHITIIFWDHQWTSLHFSVVFKERFQCTKMVQTVDKNVGSKAPLGVLLLGLGSPGLHIYKFLSWTTCQ